MAIQKRSFANHRLSGFIQALLASQLSFSPAQASDTQTTFVACQNSQRSVPKSGSCHRFDSTGMDGLFQMRTGIYSALNSDLNNLNLYQSFTKALRKKVLTDLEDLKASYLAMSSCPERADPESHCAIALEALRTAVRKDWPDMITSLSLARPNQIDPGMMNQKSAWFTSHPSHLFNTSSAIEPLEQDQMNRAEKVFLQRLGNQVPEVTELLNSQAGNVRLVATNEREKVSVRTAMVHIREDARKAYLETVKKNPILTFIGKVNFANVASPDNFQLQSATRRFLMEIEKEIATLRETNLESDKLLFTYKASAESLLQEYPNWCTAVETAARTFQNAQQASDLKTAAAQIGLSVLALGTCSTVIMCGAVAGVLGASDFHLTQEKADLNFRRGIIHASSGESTELLAISATQNQSAATSVALSAIGAVATGVSAAKSVAGTATRSLSTWDRAAAKTPIGKWKPKNAAEMQAYSSLHIREVKRNSVIFFKKNRELFQNTLPKQLKTIGRHDLEKILDFDQLSRAYGYHGIPKEITEDLLEFGDLIAKKSPDGQFIQMSIADSLQMLWGHNAQSLAALAKGGKTIAERKHWDAMLKVRQHVIESMEKIDGKIMADAYSKVPSSDARVELRLIEFISDLGARRANPMTVGEFGREMIPTGEFVKRMGRENLIRKIAGSESPMDILAARKLLDKVSMDDVARMATELEDAYVSSGLPTSLANTLLFNLHGR